MKRKLISLLLALVLLCGMAISAPVTARAAVPYPSTLYLTQQTSVSCTLCAATMMLRARTYLCDNSGWSAITEENVGEAGWVKYSGLKWSFDYFNNGSRMTVNHSPTEGMTISTLRAILKNHPEGIVLYCDRVPHAQYITDVDGGIVYSADPSSAYYFGRRPLANTRLGQIYGSQAEVLENVTAYWYVASYNIRSNVNYNGAVTGSDTLLMTASEPAGSQTISNGTYRIMTALNSEKCLEVAEGGMEAGANLQIRDRENCQQQKFHVSYLGNGYYSLKAAHSGKALDVAGGSNLAGTNVQQSDWNASYSQQWVLKDAEDGTFYIVNKNGLYLEVAGGNSANGTNVQGYVSSHSLAQKWKFVAVDGKQTLPDGNYRIASLLDTTKGVDVSEAENSEGANIRLWEYTGDMRQQFTVTYQGNGYYSLVVKYTGKSPDLHYNSVACGANVEQYSVNGTTTQNWMLREAGGGSYYIVNATGLYLDVSGANSANGANIQGWVGNGTDAQKWKFIPTAEQTVPDGTYRVTSALDETKGLNVTGGSTANGANVQLWDSGDSPQGQFVFTYVGNGYYMIRACHSGKAMDVSGGSSAAGANIQQYEANGTKAQRWLVKDAGEGYVYLVSGTGLYLDVNGGGTANGTNVHGWNGNGSAAQRWKLIPTE